MDGSCQQHQKLHVTWKTQCFLIFLESGVASIAESLELARALAQGPAEVCYIVQAFFLPRGFLKFPDIFGFCNINSYSLGGRTESMAMKCHGNVRCQGEFSGHFCLKTPRCHVCVAPSNCWIRIVGANVRLNFAILNLVWFLVSLI